MVASRLDPEQTKKACSALLSWVASQPAPSSTDLLAADSPSVAIFINITTKTAPDNPVSKPHAIPLEHPLLDDGAQACLITKDPYKDYKKLLAEKGVTRVAKVIGVKKIKEKYHPFEAKRQLLASYPIFLADARVVSILPKLLGKSFFEKKRLPLPVDLTKPNLRAEIGKAMSSTSLYLTKGTCIPVRIGHTGMTAEQVTENIHAAIPRILGHVPQAWDNVLNVCIKTNYSASLPIYVGLPKDAAKIIKAPPRSVKAAVEVAPEPAGDVSSKPAGKAEKAEKTKKHATDGHAIKPVVEDEKAGDASSARSRKRKSAATVAPLIPESVTAAVEEASTPVAKGNSKRKAAAVPAPATPAEETPAEALNTDRPKRTRKAAVTAAVAADADAPRRSKRGTKA